MNADVSNIIDGSGCSDYSDLIEKIDGNIESAEQWIDKEDFVLSEKATNPAKKTNTTPWLSTTNIAMKTNTNAKENKKKNVNVIGTSNKC